MAQSTAAEVILAIAAERDAMGFKMAQQCKFDIATYLFQAAERDRATAARLTEMVRSFSP